MKFSSALTLSSLLGLVAASPLVTPVVEKRSSSGGPRFVVYTDDYVQSTGSSSTYQGLPDASKLSGYTHLILAFLLIKGPADQAQQWKELGSSTQKKALAEYHDAGVVLMTSALGSTETPTTDGVSATSLANTHAEFVLDNNLEGIDVDYEDMGAMDRADGSAEEWLITYTKALRAKLPAGQYIITHAPVAPWFSPIYTAGAYTKVNKQVGSDIDWYNLQFYNQGSSEYSTCSNLLNKSGGDFPQSSIFEINSVAGVPLNKLVIGKPSAAYQADNGWMSFSTLATCINEAAEKGWDAGTMFWEYEDSFTTSSLSVLFKALDAIKGGGGVTTPTTTTSSKGSKSTSSPTSTSKHASTTSPAVDSKTPSNPSSNPPSSSGCGSVAAWSKSKVYDGGKTVSGSFEEVAYDGWLWANKWWTQGDTPGTEGDADPWEKVKACSSSKRFEVDAAEVEERDVIGEEKVNATKRTSVVHAHAGHAKRMVKRSHLARLNEIS